MRVSIFDIFCVFASSWKLQEADNSRVREILNLWEKTFTVMETKNSDNNCLNNLNKYTSLLMHVYKIYWPGIYQNKCRIHDGNNTIREQDKLRLS